VPFKSTSTSSFTVVEADPMPLITTKIADIFGDPHVVLYLLVLFGFLGPQLRLAAAMFLVVSMVGKVCKRKRTLEETGDKADGNEVMRCYGLRRVTGADINYYLPALMTLLAVLGTPTTTCVGFWPCGS
jgi:hypothetical protein